ncbi:MAG: hypothetical protein RL757_3074 [Bacteroidota bacterium]|jgi:hypothetical protein
MEVSSMQKATQTVQEPIKINEIASNWSRFRSQIGWLLAVACLFVAIERGIGYYLSNLVKKSQYRYSQLYFQDANSDNPDVLTVSNSRGSAFYQPLIKEMTGKTSFNLSYNGLPADLADVLVRDYIDKRRPKVIIIDPTMCDRQSPELIKDFKVYSHMSPRLDSLLKTKSSTSFYASKLFSVYRHNSEVFQRAVIHRSGNEAELIPTNFITKERIEDTATTLYKLSIDTAMTKRLRQTIAYARSQGIEVKLMISPYFKRFGENVKANFLDSLKMQFADCGLPIHDYSTSLDNATAFADYQHLNKVGAKLFIQQLVNDNMFSASSEKQNFLENTLSTPSKTPPPVSEAVLPPSPTVTPPTTTQPQTALPQKPTSPQQDLLNTPIPAPQKPRKRKSKPNNEPYIGVDTYF